MNIGDIEVFKKFDHLKASPNELCSDKLSVKMITLLNKRLCSLGGLLNMLNE